MRAKVSPADRLTIEKLVQKYTPKRVSDIALKVKGKPPGRPTDQDLNAGSIWVWIENYRTRTAPDKPVSISKSAKKLVELLDKHTIGHKLNSRSIRGLHRLAEKRIEADPQYGCQLQEYRKQAQTRMQEYLKRNPSSQALALPMLMRGKRDGTLEGAIIDTWALRHTEVGKSK